MRPADGEKFRNLLRGMGRMYGADLDNLVLDAYWLALRDWDFHDLQDAAAHLMASAKFMPKPADFTELRKTGRDTAAESWARAVGHAASSAYRRGLLGDSNIDLVVRGLGGYAAIAMCEEDKLHFLERRFCEHFETLQDAVDTREALPAITAPMALRLNGVVKQLSQK